MSLHNVGQFNISIFFSAPPWLKLPKDMIDMREREMEIWAKYYSLLLYCNMWYTNSDKKYLRRQLSLLNKMIPKWITMNSQVYWQVLISLLTFYKSTNSLWRSKDETNLYANEFIYKIKSWGTRKFYKSILVLLTTNVAEEGTSCKLKIYWHFKPHLGQSFEKENSES